MDYIERADNVYLIDTEMFGFPRYQAAYLVAGERLVLVDTGTPTSWQVVRAAIQAHGFSLDDIDHIFVTHAEHPDHSGNVGAILRENDHAVVHVNPVGEESLVHPEIEGDLRKKNLAPSMAARFGDMAPVDPARVHLLTDGEVVELGGGVRLQAAFTPGHQPSGLVLFEQKHRTLFINDLCGGYFVDADASLIFTPFRSDVRQAMVSLRLVERFPARRACLGHFGISEEPAEVIARALDKMQALLDIGHRCTAAGRAEDIEAEVFAAVMPEVEKMAEARGEAMHAYLRDELAPSLARAFAAYYRQPADDR